MPNERAIQLDPVEPSVTGQPEPTGTYPIQATCSNCDWAGEVHVRKGIACERGKTATGVSCPTCGCTTLVRNKPKPTVPSPAADPTAIVIDQDASRRMLEDLIRQQQEVEAARRGRPIYTPAPIPLPYRPNQRPSWQLGDMEQEIQQTPFIDHTFRPSTTDGTQGDGVWMNGGPIAHTNLDPNGPQRLGSPVPRPGMAMASTPSQSKPSDELLLRAMRPDSGA